jgi:all-trans-retinol dehydrogenase (NAD+)
MVAKDKGHVVTIGSLGGFVGISGQVDYSASKAASIAFTEALRRELHVS